MNLIHEAENFVAWEHTNGQVAYPDNAELFINLQFLSVGDKLYAVSNYTGNEVLTTELEFDEYFEHFHKSRLIEEKVSEIKAIQSSMLNELEGTPENPGLWQRKAVEEITIKDSFDRYDTLMKHKAHVINFGNAEEERLSTLEPSELIDYVFTCDLADAPDIAIRRLTVGAFKSRFTFNENNNFDQAMEVRPDMKLLMNSLTSRTHVHLDNKTVKDAIAMLSHADLLESEPVDNAFSSREEELLRNGTTDEQYRVLSYI